MISSVYIHIPFCNDICSYCDFCKIYYSSDVVDKYLYALENEIKNNYKNEIINTIYIGGGTPSSLSVEQLKRLFKIISIFNIDLKEFTFECNIENIDEEKVKILAINGVNRISIGVQTFDEDILKLLNRKHNEQMVLEKINMIKKYFDNINVDLMYAIAGENIDTVKKDIKKILELDVNHISTYSLIIEDNTILKNMKIEYIDDELDYEMYKLICNSLESNNYIHYETSNFSKKGYESKHNLVYWNNEHYYGFGAGASGYIDNIRYTNTKSVNNYILGKLNREEEILSLNEVIENEFILGFRKIKGIDINKLMDKYNLDINKIEFINKMINDNKLVLNDNYLSINKDLIYVSNDILLEFLGRDYEQYI